MIQAIDASVAIDIGGMPILVHTDDAEFSRLLHDRYGSFAVDGEREIQFELEMDLVPSGVITGEEDVRVRRENGRWVMERGDFRAEWDPQTRRGRVRQTANPYAIDAVLRILHSLLLARDGGFLLHAASAVRNGRAYLFSGVSGAGKTTISRLAPPDAVLLTDEISYVRESSGSYMAYGTPFAGELARIGENLHAPIAALYLLAKGPENRIEPVEEAAALRAMMRNILFFAEDPQLVAEVFQSASNFVRSVPVKRLTFRPDAQVWELIR
jgi:hypothetical protein